MVNSRLPRVSVLLASHGSPWLREAVESVLAQTFGDLELLILDDANDPRAEALAREVEDPRVRYLPSPKGLGPAANHHRGLRECRGSLVALINHDDVWRPRLLERLTEALDAEPGSVIAFADHGCIDETGKYLSEYSAVVKRRFGRDDLVAGVHAPFARLAVVSRSIPIAQAAVWRRDAVLRIPRSVHGAYDAYIAYRLARSCAGAVYVDEQLADWRQHGGALNRANSLPNALGNLRLALQTCLDPKMQPIRRSTMAALPWAARGVAAAVLHRATRPWSSRARAQTCAARRRCR